MEITPNIGLGPLRFGMRPEQVRMLLEEPETYEDWMGGNLNDSLLYHGLVLGFNTNDTYGPLSNSKFCEARINGREDVVIWGKSLCDWRRASVVDYLEQESLPYQLPASGDVNVTALSLELSFGDHDELIVVEMWSPRISR
ncbi:MAG TPA: hypothetical protein VN843_17055 [Anaerolineales bacterium]|nr:hypothetical protein [Anaerolineales bacterium]